MIRSTLSGSKRTAALAAVLLLGPAAAAQAPSVPPAVGVVERLGDALPLELVFNDEQGAPVRLGDLIRRPTILNLVYFRCPNICSPLMNEVAHMVDMIDLAPGQDYDVLTVSFDHREDHTIARNGRNTLLSRMKKKVPPEAWRFLTGSREAIAALCESVGFYFEERDQDYDHPGVTIFLSPQGRIVRYLHGVQLLPANVKLALIDAMTGKTRSLMQTVQQLCFSYKKEGNTYVLQIHRIVLAVTVVGLALFLAILLLKGKRRAGRTETAP